MDEQNKLMINTIKKLGMSSFKSRGQEELVRRVMFGDRSILGVLPTGGGKSLAIFSCLHSAERRLTIAVFSLVAVLTDIHERLQKMSERNLVPRHR